MSAKTIQELAERLNSAGLGNAQQQREIFERIRELRSAFDGPLDPESHRYLEAAGMLVAFLARMGELGGEEVRAIAVRLLRGACDIESAASTAPPAPIPARAPAPPKAAPVTSPAEEPTTARSATDVVSDMMLGQILLQRGQILDEHIQQALKVQRLTHLRMGDVLVKIGACTHAQVADALNHQASLRRVRDNLGESAAPKIERVDTRGTGLKLVGEALLGEILIERNLITRRQLERALEVQKQTGARVGEALVKLGATTMEQIEAALRAQGKERRFATPKNEKR